MDKCTVDRGSRLQRRNGLRRVAIITRRVRAGEFQKVPRAIPLKPEADVAGILIVENLEYPAVSAQKTKIERFGKPVQNAVRLLSNQTLFYFHLTSPAPIHNCFSFKYSTLEVSL